MSRHANGEYIPLVGDGKPDAHYIMGHVSHDEGIETLREAGVVYDDTVIGHAKHVYGKWSMETDEHLQMLRQYNSAGRGRFKITMFGLGIFAKSSQES